MSSSGGKRQGQARGSAAGSRWWHEAGSDSFGSAGWRPVWSGVARVALVLAAAAAAAAKVLDLQRLPLAVCGASGWASDRLIQQQQQQPRLASKASKHPEHRASASSSLLRLSPAPRYATANSSSFSTPSSARLRPSSSAAPSLYSCCASAGCTRSRRSMEGCSRWSRLASASAAGDAEPPRSPRHCWSPHLLQQLLELQLEVGHRVCGVHVQEDRLQLAEKSEVGERRWARDGRTLGRAAAIWAVISVGPLRGCPALSPASPA